MGGREREGVRERRDQDGAQSGGGGRAGEEEADRQRDIGRSRNVSPLRGGERGGRDGGALVLYEKKKKGSRGQDAGEHEHKSTRELKEELRRGGFFFPLLSCTYSCPHIL